MCLAIPAKVTAIEGMMARVEVAGVAKTASIHMVDEVKVGDFLIIHAGFALSRLDEEEAVATLRLLEQMGGLETGALE